MTSELPQNNYFKLWQGISLLLVAAVIYLSLTPKPLMISFGFEGVDKLGHFLAYFILMAKKSSELSKRKKLTEILEKRKKEQFIWENLNAI